MAENADGQEKSEDPSQKRLDDARRKGQIPRSREFNSMVMLVSAALSLLFMGDDLMRDFSAMLADGLTLDRKMIFDRFGVIAGLSKMLRSEVHASELQSRKSVHDIESNIQDLERKNQALSESLLKAEQLLTDARKAIAAELDLSAAEALRDEKAAAIDDRLENREQIFNSSLYYRCVSTFEAYYKQALLILVAVTMSSLPLCASRLLRFRRCRFKSISPAT